MGALSFTLLPMEHLGLVEEREQRSSLNGGGECKWVMGDYIERESKEVL